MNDATANHSMSWAPLDSAVVMLSSGIAAASIVALGAHVLRTHQDAVPGLLAMGGAFIWVNTTYAARDGIARNFIAAALTCAVSPFCSAAMQWNNVRKNAKEIRQIAHSQPAPV